MTPFTTLDYHMDQVPKDEKQQNIDFPRGPTIVSNLTTTTFNDAFQTDQFQDVTRVDEDVAATTRKQHSSRQLPHNVPVSVRYIFVQEQSKGESQTSDASTIDNIIVQKSPKQSAAKRPSTLPAANRFQQPNSTIHDIGGANAKLEIAIPKGPLELLPTAGPTDVGGLSPGSVEITTSTFYNDENVSQILDFLFLGTIEAAYNEPLLCRLSISRLVDLSNLRPGEVPSSKKTSCPCTCSSVTSHLRARLCVAVADSDTEDLTPYLDDINKFIECSRRSSWRVLVFCFNGDSRSAAAIVQYLMLCRKMSLQQAFNLVRKHRASIAINRGFFRMLQALDKYRGRMGFAAGEYNAHRPSSSSAERPSSVPRPVYKTRMNAWS